MNIFRFPDAQFLDEGDSVGLLLAEYVTLMTNVSEIHANDLEGVTWFWHNDRDEHCPDWVMRPKTAEPDDWIAFMERNAADCILRYPRDEYGEHFDIIAAALKAGCKVEPMWDTEKQIKELKKQLA